MARRLILGGLTFRLSDTEDLRDLEENLTTAMKRGGTLDVELIGGNKLVVSGSRLEYFVIWEEIQGQTPPVATPQAQIKL